MNECRTCTCVQYTPQFHTLTGFEKIYLEKRKKINKVKKNKIKINNFKSIGASTSQKLHC